MSDVVYTVTGGKRIYEVYQSPGSSRYNLGYTTLGKKRKFLQGYNTLEAAKFAADTKANGRLV